MRTGPMRILVSGCTRTLGRLARDHGDYLGRLVTPAGWNAIPDGSLPYAADNGCFKGLDEAAFRLMLARLADAPVKPLWVTAPDVVGSAAETLALWPSWSMVIRAHGLEPAYVLQDNQHPDKLPDARCWFVGGSTAYKESRNVGELVARIKLRDPSHLVHMGRVNTQRRLRIAYELGCDTVDGSGWSRWGDARLYLGIKWIKQLQCQGLLRQLDRLGFTGPGMWY